MLKKKFDEKQILSNNENKALINNLIAHIAFLKNELCSKETIIKPIAKNPKCNNEYFQNKNICDSNEIEKFVWAKLKTYNKDIKNFESLNRFKILEVKEID